MAFEEGGIVPGVETGDVVNARLTPGEAILPKALTETLTNMSKFGDGGSQGPTYVTHRHTHNWHAIDGASVDRMLEEHSDKFERHVEHSFRKKGM